MKYPLRSPLSVIICGGSPPLGPLKGVWILEKQKQHYHLGATASEHYQSLGLNIT